MYINLEILYNIALNLNKELEDINNIFINNKDIRDNITISINLDKDNFYEIDMQLHNLLEKDEYEPCKEKINLILHNIKFELINKSSEIIST